MKLMMYEKNKMDKKNGKNGWKKKKVNKGIFLWSSWEDVVDNECIGYYWM